MPTLTFENSEEALDTWEFAHFFYLLRAAYVHALKIAPANEDAITTTPEQFVGLFMKNFDSVSSAHQVANLFNTELGEVELRLLKINKSSPLEVSFICVVSALALAAIVSGGKVDLKRLKFDLPPLGVGIKKLREAFRLPPKQRKRK